MYFGNDPRPGDSQPIMAEKDEYVVNRNAARKHKPLLDYLNFIDEPRFGNKEMAHSAIDEAMALNTLSGIGTQGRITMDDVDTGMMQKGGKVPKYNEGGVIQDKRERKSKYTLGVRDELADSIDYFKSIDNLLSSTRTNDKYGFSKQERDNLDFLAEQGVIDVEQALKHLDNIQDAYQRKAVGFHMPRKFQTGGNVSYGGETIEKPTLEDIYEKAGVMPNTQQKPSFESSFGSLGDDRFIGTRGTYESAIESLTSKGTGAISKAMSDSASVGQGFGDIGIKKAIQQKVRESAERGVSLGRDEAKRQLFENERSINEAYMTDALNELARLESLQGTVPYPPRAGGSGMEGIDLGGGGFGGGVYGQSDLYGDVDSRSPLESSGTYDGETITYDGETYTWNGTDWEIN
tara:strand:+ start:10873 stop:12087 length:1215 start_codon:yes stop_codon:yes gene_type:complete